MNELYAGRLKGMLPPSGENRRVYVALEKFIVTRHTDEAIRPEDPAAIQHILPASCHTAGKAFTSRKVLREQLATLPTQFRFISSRDRDLLALAAQRGVQAKKKEINAFLSVSAK